MAHSRRGVKHGAFAPARREERCPMRIIPVLLLGASLAACVGGCSKKVPDGTGAENFRPPTNQTRADYLDLLNRNFGRMDANGDEALQASEITGVRADRIR